MSTTSGRKPLVMVGVGLVAVIVLYGLWRLVFGSGAVQSTNDAFVSADYTLIAPKVAGFIDEVLVQDNATVREELLKAREENDSLQLSLMEQEEKHNATATRLQALIRRVSDSRTHA